MTRNHRRAHRVIWSLLGVLVLTGLTMALALRPAPDTTAPGSATGGKP